MEIRDFVRLKTGIDLAAGIAAVPTAGDLVRSAFVFGIPLLAVGLAWLFQRYN
jgi:hypothetical protein